MHALIGRSKVLTALDLMDVESASTRPRTALVAALPEAVVMVVVVAADTVEDTVEDKEVSLS